jgi:hypothetical protein
MLKKLFTPILLLFLTATLSAQVVYEDFEGGGPGITWNAFDGTYNGVVDNPAVAGINTSANVGSYTKSGAHAFSLFLGELASPMDLSVNNRFTIQLYAGAATRLLMKLEGAGEAIEITKNIAITNRWIEYEFDFSAAASFTTITKIILFFDPGVEASADTYLFDNIVGRAANSCAGTVPNPLVIDDFECQRNATYAIPGYDDIEAIANPDVSGINTSTGVGRYTDRDGDFHAMVIDYNSALDLSVNNYVCMKVWAPVTGNLLFKLEGGVSPPAERGVQVTETNTWVEVCADFSNQAAANHKKLVFFFNAGQNGDGDIYYIDDITRTPVPAPEPLEDFEGGPSLGWMPLNNDNVLHGTFNGAIVNPDVVSGNITPTVGSYTRGSSNFSTLTAILPDGIDLSGNPQINMQVWAPAGATEVTMQLSSPTQGAVSVNQSIANTQSWESLNFTFEDFANVTDFEQINLLFDPGTSQAGTYYFDNIGQGESTVDPCEGVEPITGVLDNFECQRNANYSVGLDRLTVIDNPDLTPANPSPKVGEYVDPNDPWSALVIDNGAPLDLSRYNQLSALIWSPRAVPVLFKLEGGPNNPTEVFVDVTQTNAWVRYQVDFSAAEGLGYTRIAIFLNAGVEPGGEVTYYLDNIELRHEPFRDCVSNFETPELSLLGWRYFANGALEGNPFIVQANPAPDAVNSSSMVGTFEEANDGAEFAGAFADPVGPIALPNDNKTMTMKVWMPVAGIFTMKLEGGIDGAPGSPDNNVDYTTPMQWQELTWDFSALPDNAQYARVTIIPNFGVIPAENLTHYFDDISVAGQTCAVVSTFEPVRVAKMRVMPNPAQDFLRMENVENATTFRIINLLGQPVKTLQLASSTTLVEMDLIGLAPGVYVLAAYDQTGQLVANAKFIKN